MKIKGLFIAVVMIVALSAVTVSAASYGTLNGTTGAYSDHSTSVTSITQNTSQHTVIVTATMVNKVNGGTIDSGSMSSQTGYIAIQLWYDYSGYGFKTFSAHEVRGADSAVKYTSASS